MATAYLHSLRGKNKRIALIGVKANEFALGWEHAYVSADGVKGKTPMVDEEGVKTEDYDIFPIPEGFNFVEMTDEKGEVITSKDGEPLHKLVW